MFAPHRTDTITGVGERAPSACRGHVEAIRDGRISERWSREIRVSARKLARNAAIDRISVAEDLFAVGVEALWRAAEAFNLSYGTPFDHFARRSIRNAMLSELRRLQDPTSTARSRPFDECVPVRYRVSRFPGPSESYERMERREAVRSWIDGCSTRLQQVRRVACGRSWKR